MSKSIFLRDNSQYIEWCKKQINNILELMSDLSRREREKEERRKEILEAAAKLFGKKGFDGTSMDEVAKVSGFTKRTIYKYFINKIDLFFAIALKIFKSSSDFINSEKREFNSVYDKLKYACKNQYFLAKKEPALFRISSEVGYVRKKTGESPHRDKWYRIDDILFDGLTKLIEEGKKDGSLRPDLEPKMTAYSWGFLSNSIIQGLLESGDTFSEHFNLDMDEFVDRTIELMLSALRP